MFNIVYMANYISDWGRPTLFQRNCFWMAHPTPHSLLSNASCRCIRSGRSCTNSISLLRCSICNRLNLNCKDFNRLRHKLLFFLTFRRWSSAGRHANWWAPQTSWRQ